MPVTRSAALPQTGYATLWLTPGQAIYVGPSLNLDPHLGSVSCLAVGIDGPFTIETATHRPHPVRSALIAARQRHQLTSVGGRMAFCYLDPASTRERECRARMGTGDELVSFDHVAEQELIELSPALAEPGAAQNVWRWLDLAAPAERSRIDPRISRAAGTLRARPDRPASAGELAAEVGLSTSRFLHLFRAHTGTSFRRYRMWTRMLRAATLLAGQRDITAAAADAGFASPSHFSDSFHDMFGLSPSRLLAAKVAIDFRDLGDHPNHDVRTGHR